MLSLDRVAKLHGMHTMLLRGNIESIANLTQKFVLIVFVENDHFLIVYNIKNHIAQIIDPPKQYELPLNVLQRSLSSDFMILSDEPIELSVSSTVSRYATFVTFGLLAFIAMLAAVFMLLRSHSSSKTTGSTINPSCWFLFFIVAVTTAGCTKVINSSDPVHPHAAKNSAAPLSIAAEPLIHDLGLKFIDGPHSQADITTTITNVSQKPILITELKISCTCTSANVDKVSLQPGETTQLHSLIKIGNERGQRSSTILVYTNGESTPLDIKVFWKGVQPLDADPTEYDFGRIDSSKKHDTAISLISHDQVPFSVEDVHFNSSNPRIQMRLKSNMLSGSDSTKNKSNRIQAVLTLNPSESLDNVTSAGLPFDEIVTVTLNATNTSKERKLRYPVRWIDAPPILVIPNRIYLGTTKCGEQRDVALRFRSNTTDELQIRSIEYDTMNILASPLTIVKEKFTDLTLNIKTPLEPGPWRSTITVKILNESHGLSVPVSGINQ